MLGREHAACQPRTTQRMRPAMHGSHSLSSHCSRLRFHTMHTGKIRALHSLRDVWNLRVVFSHKSLRLLFSPFSSVWSKWCLRHAKHMLNLRIWEIQWIKDDDRQIFMKVRFLSYSKFRLLANEAEVFPKPKSWKLLFLWRLFTVTLYFSFQSFSIRTRKKLPKQASQTT